MAVRTAVGLDIGTSGVRAAELIIARGRQPVLERFGQVALPPNAIRDGEIVEVETVAAAIRQLWTNARIANKQVVVGVSNQRVIVRQVDLPWLPEAELRRSLPFQVQDFIPIPVEQAILDFHPLEEFTNDAGGRMLRVLLVAAAREMVDGATAAVQRAGLTPIRVDLTPFAILRALGSVDELGLQTEAEAIVDVGSSVTNIIVHQGSVPRFVRILLMGGNDITEAVADRLGIPAEQAESVKWQMGMTRELNAEMANHPAARVIDQIATQFIEEVRGSLDYYLSQPQAARIRRVLVSGGGGQLGGLAERLSVATRLRIEPSRALTAVQIGQVGLTPEQLDYIEPLVTVPIGLALGAL